MEKSFYHLKWRNRVIPIKIRQFWTLKHIWKVKTGGIMNNPPTLPHSKKGEIWDFIFC